MAQILQNQGPPIADSPQGPAYFREEDSAQLAERLGGIRPGRVENMVP